MHWDYPALYIDCNENLTHCYGKEREEKIKKNKITLCGTDVFTKGL